MKNFSEIEKNQLNQWLFSATWSKSLIEYLVNAGADVNVQDYMGLTPLMVASRGGFVESVIMLINLGANLEIKDSYGETALTYACYAGAIDVVKVLVENGAKIDGECIINASMKNKTDIIKFLLENGVDINARDKEGRTALIWAFICDSIDAIDLLTKEGADEDIKDAYGAKASAYIWSNEEFEVE